MANGTKGDNTKVALLEAAKQLVGERGYAGTTVRELAATSGTNLAAVNYHFGSRERLLNQAVLESFLDWADHVGEISTIDPDAGGLQQLAARARPTLEILPEMLPKFVLGVEALLQAQRSPELKHQLVEHYAELRRRIGEFIRGSTRGRELPDRMVEVVASYMLAVVDGLLLQSLLDPQAVPTGEELAALYEGLAAAARAEALADPDTDGASQ